MFAIKRLRPAKKPSGRAMWEHSPNPVSYTHLDVYKRQAVESLHLEGSYLLLLAHDTYDVPTKAKDLSLIHI